MLRYSAGLMPPLIEGIIELALFTVGSRNSICNFVKPVLLEQNVELFFARFRCPVQSGDDGKHSSVQFEPCINTYNIRVKKISTIANLIKIGPKHDIVKKIQHHVMKK